MAGAATLGGLAVLIYRRRTVGPVFTDTTRNDKLMYAVLGITIVLGLAATVAANVIGGGYDYRATISPWFRSIFFFSPDPALMAGAPILFQVHTLSALLLFAIWPFTRLVHMLTAPIGYLTRPYIVYRQPRRPAHQRPRASARLGTLTLMATARNTDVDLLDIGSTQGSPYGSAQSRRRGTLPQGERAPAGHPPAAP
ncbi:respiratory nitrate reductase subunit gamma [Nonomuraea sp. NPDC049028]|uniref:respiratory nitrate reductase subunit gamma n=1 Tax=Nonomuraea sp. NPDC049028 TaxID=3364348 RepID=UPI0037195222